MTCITSRSVPRPHAAAAGGAPDPARRASPRYNEVMSATQRTFDVRAHRVSIERVDSHRWRVSVDGRVLASFCSESRARNAGRTEARRLDLVERAPRR